jgi:hypothetical protein
MTFTALGKKIGSIVSYFDGNGGGEVISFAPEENYSGKRLEDIKAASDFYDVLNWKQNYKTITVKRMGKVGDEDVYIIEKQREKGTKVTDYISTKSFLVLRRDSLVVSETSGIELPRKPSRSVIIETSMALWFLSRWFQTTLRMATSCCVSRTSSLTSPSRTRCFTNPPRKSTDQNRNPTLAMN